MLRQLEPSLTLSVPAPEHGRIIPRRSTAQPAR